MFLFLPIALIYVHYKINLFKVCMLNILIVVAGEWRQMKMLKSVFVR